MKTLLIMFVVGICALGLRSPEIMQAVGVAASAQDPARIELAAPMSSDEFAQLSKTDSGAYRKFIDSYQLQERGEVDKLLNFFARGKYE